MMADLSGQTAWVTGAGSGIGRAAATALAGAGASLVLTGRRVEPLQAVAAELEGRGGTVLVAAGDLTDKAAAHDMAVRIGERFGRLDILVNNAGTNIRERSWSQLTPERIDTILNGNLSSAFYVASAALPLMRAQKNGVMIHTASWAGRFVSPVSGPAYTAAKHAVVAMSHSINMEEFVNGIRSSVICPAEVATPILDLRPQPLSAEERARMLQPEDMGDLILYVATRPPHLCLNEILISPTWNRLALPTVPQTPQSGV
jgi:NADP-dependent 3-hydroxy acid dehydrogenase YdfG